MITIKQAKTKKELKAFVTFPFSLYKGSKYWVPPIINQELATFNKDTNPIFKDAEATFFLAYKDNKIVGRVAAIINWLEVKNISGKTIEEGSYYLDLYDQSKLGNIGSVDPTFSQKIKKMSAEEVLLFKNKE